MAGRNANRRGRGHAGETLAEVLVTTTLLGIVGVGVIGAIASILISSDVDRQWSQGETVLRSFTAAVEHAGYAECASSANPYPSIPFSPPEYPGGSPAFRTTITGVSTWDGAGPTVVTTAAQSQPTEVTFVACPVGSGNDTGLQRVDLRIEHLDRNGAVDERGALSATVYKRDDR